jgi:acetolactate synthase small subunit
MNWVPSASLDRVVQAQLETVLDQSPTTQIAQVSDTNEQVEYLQNASGTIKIVGAAASGGVGMTRKYF